MPSCVQKRGLQVVDMDRVLRDVVAVVVGLAVDRAALEAAARNPHAVARAEMVAAVPVRAW